MRHGLWATSNHPITSGGIVESDAASTVQLPHCLCPVCLSLRFIDCACLTVLSLSV